MKNVKKITIIAVLLIVILLSLLMLNYNVSAQASSLSPEELATSQKYDEELISYVHTPEIDENFSEDEVIILKREYSDISLEKNTSKSKRILDQICKFENIEIKKINDLFPLQDQEEPSRTI